MASLMECRSGCGACCIAPSINFPYYGMPQGKPAGTPCAHLNLKTMHCAIWMTEHYPSTCRTFRPEASICGTSAEEAIRLIGALEAETSPQPPIKKR